MAIKGNIGQAVVNILAADTTLLDGDQGGGSATRTAVTAAVIHNTAGTDTTVTVYESPNTTSASGDVIEVLVINTNSTVDITSIIGQGFSTSQNIIVVGSQAGANAKITFVKYTEGD